MSQKLEKDKYVLEIIKEEDRRGKVSIWLIRLINFNEVTVNVIYSADSMVHI